MSTHRHEADRPGVAPSRAARPEKPAPILQQPKSTKDVAASPSLFGRVAQVARGTADAVVERIRVARHRLAEIGRALLAWTEHNARCRQVEEEAAKAIALAEAALQADRQAAELRRQAEALAAQRTPIQTQTQRAAQREITASNGAAAGATSLASDRRADEQRSRLADVQKTAAEKRDELKASMTDEQWAAYRKQRAAERHAEAKAKNAKAVAEATPKEENRRRNTREKERQKRVADGRKDDNPEMMVKVAKRDARHSQIYRAAADQSLADEHKHIEKNGGATWRFTTAYHAERIETSPNHHCLAMSPVLAGVDPKDFKALTVAFAGFARVQAPGVRQKPYREAVISHPVGMEVTDDWLVYQAVRHLAAQGIPPDRVPWMLARHSEKAHQHAHLIFVPVEADGTTYVSPHAVVASALETARQDGWCEIPPGRLAAPTSRLKDIWNGYRQAADGNLHSFRVLPDGKKREKIPLQGAAAAAFRLEMAGAPDDQHGHTGGTFTLKAASSTSPFRKINHVLGDDS